LNISLRQLKGAAELDVVRGSEGDGQAMVHYDFLPDGGGCISIAQQTASGIAQSSTHFLRSHPHTAHKKVQPNEQQHEPTQA